MSSRRVTKIIGIILLAQLVAGAALIAMHFLGDEPQVGSVGAVLASEEVRARAPYSIETGMEVANQASAHWSNESRLISARATIAWPANDGLAPSTVPTSGWAVYDFADGASILSVYIDLRTGSIFSQIGRRIEPASSRKSFQATYPISSNTALLAAEQIGGSTYRSTCPTERTSSNIALSRGADGRTIWVVTYIANTSPNVNDIRVVLDAETGDLIRAEVTNPECTQG